MSIEQRTSDSIACPTCGYANTKPSGWAGGPDRVCDCGEQFDIGPDGPMAVAGTGKARQLPLLCRLFGHKWRITHTLIRVHERDYWAYYAHTCPRCWTEVKRNLWPSI